VGDDFSLNFLFGLLSKAPPHKALGYLMLANGLDGGKAVERFAGMSLREILAVMEAEFAAGALISKDPLLYRGWFELLHEHMTRDLGTLIRNPELRKRYEHLLERTVGKIRLQEFLFPEQAAPTEARRATPKAPASVEAAFLNLWAKEVQNIILVAKTLAEHPSAFDQLLSQQKWANGYVGARVEEDAEVQLVLNDAWRRVYQKLHTFDASKSTFRNFALIWITHAIRYRGLAASEAPMESCLRPVSSNVPGRRQAEERIFPALKAVFDGDSPQHELFAFASGPLLEWFKAEIWNELGPEPFKNLLPRFEEALVEQRQWPTEFVLDLLHKPRRMIEHGLSVAEVIENKGAQRHYSQDCFANLLACPLADTTFRMYCPSGVDEHGFSDDFSHWIDNVKRRLVDHFLSESSDE